MMMKFTPMLAAPLFIVSTAGLIACGDHTPEPHIARAVWGTLTHSHVARPFALDELAAPNADVSPRCGGGEGHSELWHTAYAVDGEGEASGTARYTLDGCRVLQQSMSVHGELRRSFKVRRALQKAPNLDEETMGTSRRDAFYGVLELKDPEALCPVDVVRIYEGGEYTYTGSLCGHDASTLGLAERGLQ